ncbi:MAG: queuine/other tRNA-ribosyltransferase [Ignavibacteriae bacterium]|nr:queuine/other tRNA-ribosyltransferase [Ignavibacteriota bacterium]
MKYFLPDWEDRLDPKFDFETDEYSRDRAEAYESDVYAHQVFKDPPCDGILISLATFQGGKLPLEKDGLEVNLRGRKTIKGYLKLHKISKPLEVMGDCGAFEYVNEDKPPKHFGTARVAKLYQQLKFDYGVSVDHMVVDFVYKDNGKSKLKKIKLTQEEKEARRKLSIYNADRFINYHREKNLSFVPIGAAQGLNPSTYADSVNRLIEMGYAYIGIGTLIPKTDEEIIDILKQVNVVKNKLSFKQQKNLKLHLLGVVRPKKLKEFVSLGVTSLDSASFLRKAWLRSGQNYLAHDGQWYSAIRVPYSDNENLVANAEKDGITLDKLKQMEKKCLDSLQQYEDKNTTVRRVVNALINYDQLLLRDFDGNHHKDKYEKTLRERPWEKCKCEMCKTLGIHVVVFRGCNRNKRRGFHNVYVLYNEMINGKAKTN